MGYWKKRWCCTVADDISDIRSIFAPKLCHSQSKWQVLMLVCCLSYGLVPRVMQVMDGLGMVLKLELCSCLIQYVWTCEMIGWLWLSALIFVLMGYWRCCTGKIFYWNMQELRGETVRGKENGRHMIVGLQSECFALSIASSCSQRFLYLVIKSI